MKLLRVRLRAFAGLFTSAKHLHRLGAQLLLPLLDLVGMHIKALGQLSQGAFPGQGRKGNFRLKSRGMIPSFTSRAIALKSSPHFAFFLGC